MVRFVDPTGNSRLGFTQDLSRSGLFVIAGSLPSIGQHVAVQLRTPEGEELSVRGRVVRQRRVSPSLSTTIPNGFGMSVTASDESYTQLVEALR